MFNLDNNYMYDRSRSITGVETACMSQAGWGGLEYVKHTNEYRGPRRSPRVAAFSQG